MAIVGRALYRDFPEFADYYGIGALRLGPQIIPTHNGLLGRYPGADGMKTGFTCPAGFNVVASATRGGRRLIVVVLGYPNAKARTLKTASLLDGGFASGSGSTPIAGLPAVQGAAPNMRPRVCGARREQVAEDDFAVPVVRSIEGDHTAAFFANNGGGVPASNVAAVQEQLHTRPTFEPVDVYVGRAPGWTGPVLAARGDAPRVETSIAAPPSVKAKGKHVAKGRKAAKKKLAPKAKAETKPTPPARPKTAQH